MTIDSGINKAKPRSSEQKKCNNYRPREIKPTHGHMIPSGLAERHRVCLDRGLEVTLRQAWLVPGWVTVLITKQVSK